MGDVPSLDDKARYEALKKELLQALPKKRAIDKQLVRLLTNLLLSAPLNSKQRPILNSKSTTWRRHISQRQPHTMAAT
jgi:hypothetical protein